MGSPQPPLNVPNSTSLKRPIPFEAFPIDALLSILESTDSFANLESLYRAVPGLWAPFARYQNGIRKKVARNEFGPLEEVVAATKALELAEQLAATPVATSSSNNMPSESSNVAESTPQKLIWNTFHSLADLDNYSLALVPKLRDMNSAAEKLSTLYERRVGSAGLNSRELGRFKKALYRNVVFFSLYEEDCGDLAGGGHADWKSNEEDEDDQKNKLSGNDVRHSKYRARNAYLSNFTHQEVLEMDCVREFLCEIGEGILEHIQTLCEEFEKNGHEGSCFHTLFAEAHQVDQAEPDCFFCDIDKFSQALITRGPVVVVDTLEKLISLDWHTQKLPCNDGFLHGDLKEVDVQDLRELSRELRFNENDITDEVMAFWGSKKKEYNHNHGEGHHDRERSTSCSSLVTATARKLLPKGATSIMDVMRVRFYERAVMDDGVMFSTNYRIGSAFGNNNDNDTVAGEYPGNCVWLASPEITRPSTPMVFFERSI